MSSSNRSRLATFIIASVLIVSAFLAILSANSLAWPFAQSLIGARTTNTGPAPPGQLLVSANLTKYYGFTINGTTLSAQQSSQPMSGVNVTIFALNQPNTAVASGQTNNLGTLALVLSPGEYSMHLNTLYSNLSVQVSIISGLATDLSVSVNGTQHIASFYDLSDSDSIGQVLPSENVYFELTNGQQRINSSQLVYLATYSNLFNPGGPMIIPGNYTGFPTFFPGSFFQHQEVPATIASIANGNFSLWVEARPHSPLNTFGVKYVGVEQFSTTYNITNSTSGAPIPLA